MEDGQTAPRISDWQARLSESSEAVLSVLSDAMEKIAVKEQAAEWQRLHTSLLQEREALLTLLATAVSRIPIPKGFFVGEAERVPAYDTVCRLLGNLEARMQKLQVLGFDLSKIQAWLFKQRRNADRVELALWEIGCAAKNMEQTQVTAALEGFRKRLTEARFAAAELREAVERADQALLTLSSSTIPDFCTRTYAAADMEHDGAACNPAAAASLCGELRAILERLSF